MPRNTVLLIDDHEIVRTGVRALLEAEDVFEVVGEAANAAEAVLEARRLSPDFVLMDITLPDVSGLEVLARIKETAPNAQVIVLTMHDDEDYFFRAIQAGAAGYVVKGAGSDQILAALRAVQNGGVYLHPTLARALVADHLRERDSPLV
ncbi:MAG: response regulator transcription factor, partial [Chloroflexi bacterium]|nr:response regulator transcription factor [Chloroflexota bacterium]